MKRNKLWVPIFLAPGLALFCFVFLISIVLLLTTSFSNWTIGSDITFAGFSNFKTLLFDDPDYIKSIGNTIIWILLQSTVHIFVGVLLALILANKKWYTNSVRTIFMIPNIISSAAMGMLFLCLMNPQFGLVNSIVKVFVGEEFAQNWFMNPKTAFFSVTLTWLFYAGMVTILIMAEMASIPEELYEAATVDGASTFQINIHIILPMMKNIIGTATILAATSMLKKLDIIMMTTAGGPNNKTMNMPMYLYQTALTDNNYGLANAQGILLIIVGLIVVFTIRNVYGMNHTD